MSASERRITIRPAAPEDARAILECHYSAVHEIAARDYPPAILNEWSPPVTTERVASYSPHATTLVAEVPPGASVGPGAPGRFGANPGPAEIVGFGEIVAAQNELRAVYVAAHAGRSGVGSALLQALETLARAARCTVLTFDSSITAERFYLRHNYVVVSRGVHTLSSGGVMACVRMTKRL